MYSIYEEMGVIKEIIQTFSTERQEDYKKILNNISNRINQFSLNMEKDTPFNVKKAETFLKDEIELLSMFRSSYEKSLRIVEDIDKIIKESEDKSITNDELRQKFNDIRTNYYYNDIMKAITSNAIGSDNYFMKVRANTDLNSALATINQDFSTGNLTKKQLIFYNNIACINYSFFVSPKYPEYSQYLDESVGNKKI